MALIVQKFGGVTVENPKKIASIASRVQAQKEAGDSLVVVVSAIGQNDREPAKPRARA